jgi:hypothetical protein
MIQDTSSSGTYDNQKKNIFNKKTLSYATGISYRPTVTCMSKLTHMQHLRVQLNTNGNSSTLIAGGDKLRALRKGEDTPQD